MIDFFRFYLSGFDVNQYCFLSLGILLCLQGSAGIIASGIGVRAMDLVAIRLEELGLGPFWVHKWVAESLLLASGYYLGGPVGIGTIAFLVAIGGLLQPSVKLNRNILKALS
jgi:hypothetical protein